MEKQTPIENLFEGESNFQVYLISRAFNDLDINNMETLANDFCEDDFTRRRGVGKGSLDYINEKLNKYGLKLRKYIPEKILKKIMECGYKNKTMKEVGLGDYHYNWLEGEGLTTDINLGKLIEILEENPKPFGLGKVRIRSIRRALENL